MARIGGEEGKEVGEEEGEEGGGDEEEEDEEMPEVTSFALGSLGSV